MSDWKSVLAGIAGLLLPLLFLLRRRSRERSATTPGRPDVISEAATTAERIHRGCSSIMAVIILAAVGYGVVVDRLARLIILTTAAAVVLIWVYARTVKEGP